ncbi:Uncharacterised protein [Mycobacterium tuberculosis]|nr:Uncharacterised protein [Mycobacterium tuberculosis]
MVDVFVRRSQAFLVGEQHYQDILGAGFVERLGHLANSDAGGRVGRQDRDGMSLSHLRQ